MMGIGLPSGVVTFLFTDVVGSTRLWETEPTLMGGVMARHDELIEAAVEAAGGVLVRPRGEGDSRFAVFTSPRDALVAAARLNVALNAESWPTATPITVRTALHAGEADLRAGDYYGDAVNRCARLRGIAHPGQILLTSTTAGLVGGAMPAGITMTDLGEHRLKDLTRAEHVYQLNHDDPPDTFPPLLSLNQARHNLPIQTSSFIGRESELEALVAAVRANRMVTLTGFGGMGKTRLALQAAAELAGSEVGDVWFIDLSGLTDHALVPARVAEALDVHYGLGNPARALAAALADKPTLLVLDNLEQILDCAHFVADLLARTATVRVLATSREPLHIRGERQIPLAPMPAPDANATAAQLEQTDAIRLFLDRATAVRPDFTITGSNAAAVAAICARLDGHPLALELAAARMKMFTADALLGRLTSNTSVLASNAPDVPERQRTLRATIAWSVDALTPEEHALLDVLSVLSAPADFDLVEALCPDGLNTLALLADLVDKSLVHTVESADDDTRYALLVAIRDHLTEQLAQGSRDHLHDRHATYFQSRLTTAFNDGTFSGQDRVVARDLPHLRAAIAYRRSNGPTDAEVRLVTDLGNSMSQFGHAAEYLEMSAHALTVATDAGDRAILHWSRGDASEILGLAAQADHELRLAVAEGRESGNPEVIAQSVLGQMKLATAEDDLLRLAEELETTLRDLNLTESELGYRLQERDYLLAKLLGIGNPALAEEAARRMLGHEADLVARGLLASLLLDRGAVHEALFLAAELDKPGPGVSPDWAVGGLLNKAAVLLAFDQIGEARELARRGFDADWAEGRFPWDAAILLSEAELRDGRPDNALEILDLALTRSANAAPWDIARLAWRRTVLLQRNGRHQSATSDLTEAIAALAEQTFSRGLKDLLAALVARAQQDHQRDPARAARLLGCVRAQRRTWTLPFEMDAVARDLEVRLLPDRQADYDAGWDLDPTIPDIATRSIG